MFSQSHQGRGGIGGGSVLPQLQCDQWSVPSHRWQVGLEPRKNIGCFSPNPFYVWWLAWFQVPTPLPSQIFLRTSFCHFCQTAVWQRGQKTHRSIKFFLKVTQIILDVWRPNSNKSQYHQFVWVLSSDLVQWLRYLLAISFLEVRKAEKAAPTPPTNATWLQTNPLHTLVCRLYTFLNLCKQAQHLEAASTKRAVAPQLRSWSSQLADKKNTTNVGDAL